MPKPADAYRPWRTSPGLYWSITFIGVAAFCVYSRSWQDIQHAMYDVSSGLAVFSFIAHVVVAGMDGRRNSLWWARVALLVPMSVVPFGRAVWAWRISGHLTDVMIVAIIQTADRALPPVTRLVYWVPVLIAMWIRWLWFDVGGHGETYAAVGVATAYVAAAGVLLWYGQGPGSTGRPGR